MVDLLEASMVAMMVGLMALQKVETMAGQMVESMVVVKAVL